MTALNKNRDTERQATAPIPEVLSLPVKGSVEIFVGALVGLKDGYLVPASADEDIRIVGRAEEHVDTTGLANGDKSINVRQGVFKWGNSGGGQAIAVANVGEICFAKDDQTVQLYSGTDTLPIAGVVVGLDTDGVWVETHLSLIAALRLAGSDDSLS